MQPLVDHDPLGVQRVVGVEAQGRERGLGLGQSAGVGVGGVSGRAVHDLATLHVHVQVVVVQTLTSLE